jgi:suppressor for copper-sensitivity B
MLPLDRFAARVSGAAAIALSIGAVLAPLLPGQAAPIPDEAAGNGPWRPYDASALHRLVADGRVVFVDVTAAWCLICKANELTVLERPPVAGQLREPGVVAMRADWTRPDPMITAYLQGFDRYGVPLDVVYGPGSPDGVALPELLTSGAVMDAFRRAASAPARKREVAQ